jgi:xylulokinase
VSFVLGVDVSTNAAKAIVVGAEGRIKAEGRAEFKTENPCPGGFEQNAEDWYSALMQACKQALSTLAPAESAAVKAMAITHQRETFVFCDQHGTVLGPAIVWMDERAKREVETVVAIYGAEALGRISGKPPCVTPSLYKIRWALQQLAPERTPPGLRVLDVHGFLTHRLTGAWGTSLASADPLGLVDLAARDYSSMLLEAARLDPSNVVPLFAPGAVIAPLTRAVATELGLADDVVMVAGAGDGQAAGFGAGVLTEDALYLNLGTALVGGTPSRSYRSSRAFRTLFAADGDGFLCEMDLKGGTLTLDWLCDRVLKRTGETRSQVLAALELESSELKPGECPLVLPYFAGVMNPHWNDWASGAVLGLRADHGAAHLYRGILEGLAFEQRLALEALEVELGMRNNVFVTGGASRRDSVMQLLADVLGRPIVRSSAEETTALGAAMLAAPRAGLSATAADAARAWTKDARANTKRFEPGPRAIAYDRLYHSAYKSCYATLASLLQTLSDLRD